MKCYKLNGQSDLIYLQACLFAGFEECQGLEEAREVDPLLKQMGLGSFRYLHLGSRGSW